MTTEWALARRTTPFIVENPRPYRPHALLMLDIGSGLILGSEVVEPTTSAAEAAEWAAKLVAGGPTLVRRKGRASRPRTLRVEDAAIAAALARRLGPGTTLRVGPVPEADEAMESMAQFVEQTSGGGTSVPEPDVSVTELGAFYAAAAAFYRLAPWKFANDSQVLRLDAPGLDLVGACATILGAAGETYGLVLTRSLDDYLTFLRNADAPAPGRRYGAGVELFMVSFDHVDDIPGGRKLRKRVKAHGFDIAGPRAYPWIQKLAADGVALPVELSDVERATASLQALTAFLRKHASVFEAQTPEAASETVMVSHGVTVTAPYPGVPWRWGEELALDGLRRVEAEAARDAYLASRRAAGASEAQLQASAAAVSDLIEFCILEAGQGLAAWTPRLVGEYMGEHYPRRGPLGGEVDTIPGELGKFFEWLGQAGRLAPKSAKAIRQRIDREAKSFARAAGDPRRFGPAKAIVAAMLREGVDPTDEGAVRLFMEGFNRRLAKDPDLLPMPDLRGAMSPARKWVWDGQPPPPDPRGACPCGSGRRYRKCCMPR